MSHIISENVLFSVSLITILPLQEYEKPGIIVLKLKFILHYGRILMRKTRKPLKTLAAALTAAMAFQSVALAAPMDELNEILEKQQEILKAQVAH